MTWPAEPHADDALAAHADEGWRLGVTCVEDLDAGREPDPATQAAAIGHLRTAVMDGVDGVVLREPMLCDLLGVLLLHVPAGDVTVADDAHAAFAEGLDCPELEQPQRLSLLAGVLQACRRRLIEVQSPAVDAYHPPPDIAEARDALVDAARELFLAVPLDHEWSAAAATALIRALAVRLVGDTRAADDAADLLRLVRARPDLRATEGPDEGGTLVLITGQALMIAYEHDGREDHLVAVADLVAEAHGWPDLPPQVRPLATSMLASAIVNGPEGGVLADRLAEAGGLLDDVLAQLPADDPHRPQIEAQRAILLKRLATGGGETALADAAAELDRAAGLLAAPDTAGDTTGTRSMLTGLLGGVLDTRFQQRQDLRDARASLRHTERALSELSGSDLQRAMLLGNQAVGLLRLGWTERSPEAVAQALVSVREALDVAPPGSPIELQLHGILAGTLLLRSGAERTEERTATLREAWAAAERASAEEPPNPQTLVIQLALAQLLGAEDSSVAQSAANAKERLRQARAALHAAGRSTEAIDTVESLFGAVTVHRHDVGAAAIDDALATTDARLAGLQPTQLAWQMLAMQRARLLRRRDTLRWRESLARMKDDPAEPDVPLARLREWLDRGGSDIGEMRELVAGGLVREIQGSPDRRQSRAAGLQVLHGHVLRVLLQSGTRDAVVTAQAASGDSHEVVAWCLADGADDEAITALETGRALTLLAVGAAGSVGARLEAAGEPELARAWRDSQDGTGRAADLPVPDDVRHRVIDRLAAAGDLTELLRPPDRRALAATLRELGYDALVYLVPRGRSPNQGPDGGTGWDFDGESDETRPGEDGASRPGGALTVTAGEHVRWLELPELAVGPHTAVGEYLRAHHTLLGLGVAAGDRDAWRDSLDRICRWAWEAAMGPLMPTLSRIHADRRARVVLVPVDALCVVPWHAAHPPSDADLPAGERRYATDTVTFSYAASGGLLTRVAQQPRSPLGSAVLLVGDPGGDLPFAQAETQALRAAFYPDAAIWGEPPELTQAAATPARIGRRLADEGCSLLHYAGHATVDPVTPGSSALVLGDQRLRAETISRLTPAVGYCVCLAACTTHLTTRAFDEVFTLSTAFMLGGATTVLGSLWRLKDAGTAIFMFMIHHHLGRGLRPVDALRRAQTWMLDEGRRVPASMPPALREAITGVDLTDPVTWAGVVHQGW